MGEEKKGEHWKPSPYVVAAEVLLEKGLAIRRVPGLIEKAILENKEYRERLTLDALPESNRAIFELSHTLEDLDACSKLASAYLRLGDPERADEAIQRMEESLHELGTRAASKPALLRSKRARYWRFLGELAEAESRNADALAFYLRAQSIDVDDTIAERVDRIWDGLGGSADGWEALKTVQDNQDEKRLETEVRTGWEMREEPLTDFELVDLENRTWRPGDLKGKSTLINVWATWCGPCRLELPYLQQLQKDLADRPEFKIITLNIDQNPGLIVPYLKKEGLNFTVLLAEAYIRELQGGSSIPQNWIVDPTGILRWSQLGFSPEDAREWAEETRRLLEDAATSSKL